MKTIEEIVAGLKESGLDEAGIQAALQEMLDKGEITQEDYDKALAMIAGESNPEEGAPAPESDEERRMRLFGI